jgi:hypothetical protein
MGLEECLYVGPLDPTMGPDPNASERPAVAEVDDMLAGYAEESGGLPGAQLVAHASMVAHKHQKRNADGGWAVGKSHPLATLWPC